MPSLLIEHPAEPPRTFNWSEGSIGIGRHPQNHVALSDGGVSRWHAAIFADSSGGFHLRDPGSRRGVRLGSRLIQRAALALGDTFHVGACRLTLGPSGAIDELAVVPVDDDPDAPLALRELASEPEWLQAAGAGGDADRSLPHLLASVREIGSKLDVDGMLTALLESVDAAVEPSECCVALVRDDGTLDVRARRSSSTDRARSPLPMSRTLLHRSVESRRPLFAGRIASDSELSSPSVRALGIVGATCIPLVTAGRVRAILHADWRQDREYPSDTRLDWMAILAVHATTALEKCLLHGRLRKERDVLAESQGLSTELVGVSRALRDLIDLVDRCAGADIDVLVTGETGTGKELVARRIHERSRRRDRPFVAVNCAAVPPELFEAEFFGHVKGAFTHAVSSRIGRFEEAQGGTILLDEIGEMSLPHQAKLLRILEERRVTPVGGTPRDLDIRVVAATNRDMNAATDDGRVRDDLRRRLGVPVGVPALRDRSEDIPMLAHHLLDRLGATFERHALRITPPTMDRLMAHSWPGNVRELASCLRNALLFSGTDVEPEHLRLTPELLGSAGAGLPSLAAVEKEHLARVLRATGGHQARAARILGVNENTVKSMMERHGLDRADFSA